jgi:hypothetical protein
MQVAWGSESSMGPPTAQEAFMTFISLIGGGLLLLILIGVAVAIVIAASSSRGRDDER